MRFPTSGTSTGLIDRKSGRLLSVALVIGMLGALALQGLASSADPTSGDAPLSGNRSRGIVVEEPIDASYMTDPHVAGSGG